MSRWSWILSELSSRLWIRASLYGIVAMFTALAAIFCKRFIPVNLSQQIGADAVDSILNIMAASMLSVTIFSLSTMVSAYGAATSNVTPRATKLLIEDKISHAALSTFIGAFIFSIVGIIALKTGAYGDSGRLILFVVTIGVITMIVITLLRWIAYLAQLGRVNETIDRVEKAAMTALEERLRNPYLGGEKFEGAQSIPNNASPVPAQFTGYVQHIDMARLAAIADKNKIRIYIQAPPGKFLDENLPLAFVNGMIEEDTARDIRKAFIVGNERFFKQDPRFGIAVLSEIGTRAVSKAINDPGSAIYVTGVAVRVLSLWAKRTELAGENTGIKYPGVFVPPLHIDDLLDDFFPPMARDGAGILEVHIRLQKAYAALARTHDAELIRAARHHAALSLKHALGTLYLDEEKEKITAIAAPLLEGR
ncbi:MAG: DUF2254 domain-containing protein [Bdellovibrionales bacterium]|nr:DUF2254 domain-containing protein [Bdellovibrionales bacterium]